MAAWTRPTVNAFKARWARDFNYAPAGDPDNLDYVTDADITTAMTTAEQNFNSGLFGDNDQVTNVFMFLAAFYLVWSLQTSAQGVSSQSNFPISSQSVGGVALSFSIPEKYAKHPALSIFTQNGYGMMYLSLALPFLAGGNVGVVYGGTTVS